MDRPKKTLAMKVLEGQGIQYQVVLFPETIHDALGVAEHTGLPPSTVYKTLVVQAQDPNGPGKNRPLLIIVAADRSLDLKKVAHAAGAKRVEMAPRAEAELLTGLKVGGISALALLGRGFEVYLDEQAYLLEEIVVSAGQRGINLRLKVKDLRRVTGAEWADVSRPGGAEDG
jgi:Cys-tRNA(Pro)/Cys-tRNA(Cys) deacylase